MKKNAKIDKSDQNGRIARHAKKCIVTRTCQNCENVEDCAEYDFFEIVKYAKSL
jgi:hypothetical protein